MGVWGVAEDVPTLPRQCVPPAKPVPWPGGWRFRGGAGFQRSHSSYRPGGGGWKLELPLEEWGPWFAHL